MAKRNKRKIPHGRRRGEDYILSYAPRGSAIVTPPCVKLVLLSCIHRDTPWGLACNGAVERREKLTHGVPGWWRVTSVRERCSVERLPRCVEVRGADLFS
jgi:hypothetical protein